MAWAPQSTRSSLRSRMIASSISAEIRCGDECGSRERSASPAGPSASNRRRYLKTVWREISNSRHNTVTFTGTPLENTASSFASIDTTFCAMLHSIERQLGVSDVPQQDCQRSQERQHFDAQSWHARRGGHRRRARSATAPSRQPGHREKPGQRRTRRRTRPRTTAIRRPAQLTPLSPPARRRQGCAAGEDPLRVQNSPIALLAYLLQEGLERVDHVAVTGGAFLTCLRVFFTVRRTFLGRGSAG